MNIPLLYRNTKITQSAFHNANTHVYFGFIRIMETLHKTNSVVFMYLQWLAPITPTLSTFGLLMSEERLKGKVLDSYGLPYLSPFLLGHPFQHKWSANGGKKQEEKGMWWRFLFRVLRKPFLLSVFEPHSASRGKCDFSGLWALPTSSGGDVTLILYLLWVLLNSHLVWIH